MTSQEYTQWLKGFLDAINGYDISKRQFDTIREKLKEVDDTIGTPIGNGIGTVIQSENLSWNNTKTNLMIG
jgi:hypothetical protein